jgi:hypothetical protein
MLKFIKEEIKPDIVIWTGDTISHSFWADTRLNVIDKLTIVSQTIESYLADSV